MRKQREIPRGRKLRRKREFHDFETHELACNQLTMREIRKGPVTK